MIENKVYVHITNDLNESSELILIARYFANKKVMT